MGTEFNPAPTGDREAVASSHAASEGARLSAIEEVNFRRDAAAMNEALLVSGLRQHELTAEAVRLNALLENEIIERKLAEVSLQAANERLAGQADELERLVAERTARLRESVADLEGFSYSIVHDLRAPLQGMQGFARILLDDHAAKFDADARGYLERIARSAARMDMLIHDVLDYTRAMRGEAPLATVDLDRLVRDMIDTDPTLQPPRVLVRIEGTLPAVFGHEGFLAQCVANLLGNAVKFVTPGTTPQVRIWAEEGSPSATQIPWARDRETPAEATGGVGVVVRVWFEDNGIGIAPGDHHRVFRMFERSNPADEFEGTGIGLVIVQKALQRMGGRIGFESEAGKGSGFWIELRKAPMP